MKFDFLKNCQEKNCKWLVWDGCIFNDRCFNHCECPESKSLKTPYEKYKHVEKQKNFEREKEK